MKVGHFNTVEDNIGITVTREGLEKREVDYLCRKIHFHQKLAETEDELPPHPNLEFQAQGTLEIADLVEVLEFAQRVTEYITFSIAKRSEVLLVKGECSDKLDESDLYREIELKETRIRRRAEALYHIEYLLQALKFSKTKARLNKLRAEIAFATIYPLRITIPVGHSKVQIFQASRVLEKEEVDDPKTILGRLGCLILAPWLYKVAKNNSP